MSLCRRRLAAIATEENAASTITQNRSEPSSAPQNAVILYAVVIDVSLVRATYLIFVVVGDEGVDQERGEEHQPTEGMEAVDRGAYQAGVATGVADDAGGERPDGRDHVRGQNGDRAAHRDRRDGTELSMRAFAS
ncbi:MAG: hypothetical protein HS111_03040 [Kofleriaceae bacterium]|nr:hypothetical protein [Kofleriaceae bacterium]